MILLPEVLAFAYAAFFPSRGLSCRLSVVMVFFSSPLASPSSPTFHNESENEFSPLLAFYLRPPWARSAFPFWDGFTPLGAPLIATLQAKIPPFLHCTAGIFCFFQLFPGTFFSFCSIRFAFRVRLRCFLRHRGSPPQLLPRRNG